MELLVNFLRIKLQIFDWVLNAPLKWLQKLHLFPMILICGFFGISSSNLFTRVPHILKLLRSVMILMQCAQPLNNFKCFAIYQFAVELMLFWNTNFGFLLSFNSKDNILYLFLLFIKIYYMEWKLSKVVLFECKRQKKKKFGKQVRKRIYLETV